MTRRRSTVLRIAPSMTLVVAMAGAVVAGAQAPKEPDWRTLNVGGWLAAVKAHVPGKADEPLLGVAAWSTSGTRNTVERAIRDKAGPDVLAKGLVLHTDIAIMERTSRQSVLTMAPSTWVFLDGRSLGPQDRSPHWDIARRIASALVAPPARDVAPSMEGRPPGAQIARAWIHTVVALEHEWAEFGLTHSPLGLGALLFPEDPVLPLYAGTMHQALADPRVQRFLASKPPVTFRVGTMASELGLAEDSLRRALTLDPTLAEARVRLAHVASDRGRPDEAATLAREALAGPLPPFLEYYAAMVLGRAEARLGRGPEARMAFERAAARFPKAQSAQVALTHVAVIDGRTSDGLETAIRTMGKNWRDENMDPWDWYFRVHQPDAEHQLAALRASVR